MGLDFEAASGIILSGAVSVHRALGPGFLESTYAKALQVALGKRGVPFQSEVVVPVVFEGESVGAYRLDLVVADRIVVELKAVARFERIHFAQLRAYLRATGLRVGLLLNFNAPVLAVRRVVEGRPIGP